ncbi:glycosyltransferase family 4 protein [Phenylobacterium sp.]|uniref:glycosyltransferase family 4 protein n=1 Tax=Phenylobacterium sp. TaxID=1871053 RepID=UPI002737DBF2|nr:glycosyltransferase [Phenylobacterium sp.]MDP3868359.1 glycosyltransferase [Phenylobacterium sp.]
MTLFDVADSSKISGVALSTAINQALGRFDPDVVLVPGWASRGAMAMLSWCLANNKPAVVMSESTESDHVRAGWREFVKRQILSCCGAGLVGGSAQREYLASLGIDADAIALGYNAVDNRHFEEGADAARANEMAQRISLNLPEQYILASARFIPIKNLMRLLEAFAVFRRLRCDTPTKLVLLGDGEQRGELELARARLGLEEAVVLPGFIQYNDLPKYYGLAEAFIHVSEIEPWGLVVNEAMASGLPVLVSRACGCADTLVRDGENGYLVAHDDIDAIAEHLAALDMDGALRTRMGACSRTIVAEWSPERFAKGALEAAQIALERGPAPATFAQRALLGAFARHALLGALARRG